MKISSTLIFLILSCQAFGAANISVRECKVFNDASAPLAKFTLTQTAAHSWTLLSTSDLCTAQTPKQESGLDGGIKFFVGPVSGANCKVGGSSIYIQEEFSTDPEPTGALIKSNSQSNYYLCSTANH